MALLLLNNRVPTLMNAQTAHRWNQIFTSQAKGKTVLIVGAGNLGSAGATEARKLGFHVIGVTRSGRANDRLRRKPCRGSPPPLLPRADFVVVAVPSTAATDGMFGETEFALMKQGAAFVNFGRARVCDYAALSQRLRTRRAVGGSAGRLRPRAAARRLTAMGRPEPADHAALFLGRRGRLHTDDPGPGLHQRRPPPTRRIPPKSGRLLSRNIEKVFASFSVTAQVGRVSDEIVGRKSAAPSATTTRLSPHATTTAPPLFQREQLHIGEKRRRRRKALRFSALLIPTRRTIDPPSQAVMVGGRPTIHAFGAAPRRQGVDPRPSPRKTGESRCF